MYTSSISVYVKFHDFTKINKQITLDNLINSDNEIYENVIKIFNKLWNEDSDKKVRSLGVALNNLTDIYKVQLSIFNMSNKSVKTKDNLQKTIDEIKHKYGDKSITYADMLKKEK